VYINYFNATGTQLNQTGGQVEMSLHAAPMVLASAPLNVRTCTVLDETSSSYSSVPRVSFSVRVYWDRPPIVGYDTYFPSNAYGIDRYHIEVSANATNFSVLTGSMLFVLAQYDTACKYDGRLATVTGLAKEQVYYFRIAVCTIIGTGVFSATRD